MAGQLTKARFRIFQYLLHRSTFSVIARDFGESNEFSGSVPQRSDYNIGPELGTIFANSPPLVFSSPIPESYFQFPLRFVGTTVIFRKKAREVLTQYFFALIPFEPLRSQVPAADATLWVQHEDRIILHGLN